MGEVKLRLAVLFLLLASAACSTEADDAAQLGRQSPEPQPSTRTGHPAGPDPSGSPHRPGRPRVVGTVARDLAVSWGITFLPDGTALVGERDTTRVLAIPAGGGAPREVGRMSLARPRGEAGLLGLAASPSYGEDGLVYAYVSTTQDNRVVRMEYDGARLGPAEPVLTGIPNGFIHDGGRLLFADDGALFVSTGETGQEGLAQDRDSLAGKILRITPDDGSPQCAGPRLRRPRAAVGQRVRRQHLGRAQPDRPRPQLRLAARRGTRGPGRAPRPVRAVAHLRGVAVRARVPRRVAVDGVAARPAALAGAGAGGRDR